MDVKVPGSDFVGQALVTINPPADPDRLPVQRRAADGCARPRPRDALHGSGPGVRGLGLGRPQRRSARAAEAVRRLNDAAAPPQGQPGPGRRDARPGRGQPGPRAHGHRGDAARHHGRGRRRLQRGLDAVCAAAAAPVTRARLAVWWGAVARDLVRLLVRWEAPQYTAALAAEGRPAGRAARGGAQDRAALASRATSWRRRARPCATACARSRCACRPPWRRRPRPTRRPPPRPPAQPAPAAARAGG